MGFHAEDEKLCQHFHESQNGPVLLIFLVGLTMGVAVPASILITLIPSMHNYYVTTQTSNTAGRQLRSVESSSPEIITEDLNHIVHTRKVELTSGGNLEDYISSYGHLQEVPSMTESDTSFTEDSATTATEFTPEINPDGKAMLYTAILTSESRVTEFSAAIQTTWGSGLKDHQFFYGITPDFSRVERAAIKHLNIKLAGIEAGEPYGFEHIRQSLAYMCRNIQGRYHWHALIRDTSYINTVALRGVLLKLSSSQPIILGQPILGRDTSEHAQCSVEPGLILSEAALAQVCTDIEQCQLRENPSEVTRDGLSEPHNVLKLHTDHMTNVANSLASCIHQRSGIACLDSRLLTDDFYLLLEHGIRIYSTTPKLLTAFVGPCQDVSALYWVHMRITRLRMSKAREELLRLTGELATDPASVRPKRDSEKESNRESSYLMQELLADGTAETFSSLIDDTDHIYMDSCRVSPKDIKGDQDFDAALVIAGQAIEGDAMEMEELRFRLDKANMGTEYHMFYLQSQSLKPGMKKEKHPHAAAKIQQAIVAQTYKELNVENKEAKTPQQIQVFVPMPEQIDKLKAFLRSVETVCSNVPGLSEGCAIWIMCPQNDFATSDEVSLLMQKQYRVPVQRLQLSCHVCALEDYQQLISNQFLDDKTIVALLTAEHIFSQNFLLRCMLNANPGKRVYFPVSFQKYDASVSLIEVSEESGFWKSLSYDAMCACVQDLRAAPLGSATSLETLHDYYKESYYQVYRVPDPELQTEWRSEWCCNTLSGRGRSNEECREAIRFMDMT